MLYSRYREVEAVTFIRCVEIDWDAVAPDSYLRGIPALRFDGPLRLDSGVTFFVGENGTGKSTLLEGIAVAWGFNPEGGGKNYRFSTYDSHSGLHKAVRLVRNPAKPRHSYFLRAESFYNVASKAEEYRVSGLGESSEEDFYARYGGKALHHQSHGESFLHLAEGEFRPGGLYLLDEPEAALSPQRQLSLLVLMHDLAAQGAQFIVASHSPILLGMPDAAILTFDDGEIHPCQWRDTESYRVTELFINQRDRLLRQLLED